MSVNVQNKLLHYEMPPPEGAWEKIALRLDTEFDLAEAKISNKLSDAVLEPPADVWQNIKTTLDKEQEQPKVIPFKWKRLAAAAVVIGILITTAVYYKSFQSSTTTDELAVNNNKKVDTVNGNMPKSNKEDAIDLATLSIEDNIPREAVLFPIPKRVKSASRLLTAETPSNNEPDEESPIKYITKRAIQLADATEEAAILGPPIRDANGKIIMDLRLLTTQSANYITVTGPNGEQTHISAKFANFLAYLNTNSGEKEEYLDFLIRQSSVWKKRFEDWRAKILQQANFSPSCATFFDILELKELIKE